MTEISPPADPRRRLRELLAIPERDRSDEQWDEIIELEISMAPGNRELSPDSGGAPRRNVPMPGGERKPSGDRRANGDRNRPGGNPRPSGDRQRNGPPRSGGDRRPAGPSRSGGSAQPAGEQQPGGGTPAEPGAPAKKPFKKFHKRPPKANTPE